MTKRNHLMDGHLPPPRVSGLDTIRFLAALIVLLGHFFPPLPDWLGPDTTGFARVIRGVVSCLFNGPAAVIVFFVVSGFCIHYPQTTGGSLHTPSYLTRRLTRICLPAIVAVAWCLLAGVRLYPPHFGIFWSIICEILYYLAYPALFWMARKTSWESLIGLSTLLCIFLWCMQAPAIHEEQGSYTAFGFLTPVNGLPCWLLGCWVAHMPIKTTSPRRVWILRCVVLSTSVVLRIAKFHVPSILAGNPISLNFFAFLVAVWLRHEVSYRRTTPAAPLLESMGKWSYSVYLVHPVVPAMLGVFFAWNGPREFWPWVIIVMTSLALSYVFHRLVELPSLMLARHLGRSVETSLEGIKAHS